MQTKLFLGLLVLSPLLSSSQDHSGNSCHKFFKGKFIAQGKEYIKIKRNARYQYETNTKDKMKSKYKIKWVDDCVYTLTMVRTTDKNLITRDKIGAVQPHTIRNTDGEKYTYTTNFSFMSRDICGTLRRFEANEETLIKIR